MAEKISATLGRNYADRYHRLDPNLQSIAAQPEAARFLRFDIDRITSSSYRSLFFERANLCDKYSLLFSRRSLTFYCNFYRLTDTGGFQPGELSAVESLTPLLTSSIQQHAFSLAGDMHAREGGGGTGELPVPAAEDLFSGLSPRETAVCQRIFMGLSNEAVALDMGLSIHTVRTYRQRLYKKAGVTNVNELYAKFAHTHKYRPL